MTSRQHFDTNYFDRLEARRAEQTTRAATSQHTPTPASEWHPMSDLHTPRPKLFPGPGWLQVVLGTLLSLTLLWLIDWLWLAAHFPTP
jgi:hypothetical protein